MQVQLIKHSIANGIQIATFILEYPRFIHSEVLTHRQFSRNAASSRAIPTSAIIQNIRDNPAEAVWWGKNMSGMQAAETLTGWRLKAAKLIWASARECAILGARIFNRIGLHKQLANRILEPFQNIRVVVTSTEWNNFFTLRNHKDAQPEFRQLALLMHTALNHSNPQVLNPGEWHIPYIETARLPTGRLVYLKPSECGSPHVEIEVADALRLSASLAAQESYRKSDTSLDKANAIWERLVGSAPVHASPTEHQAQVMEYCHYKDVPMGGDDYAYQAMLETPGVTHMDRYGFYWSGNFRGYIQHRQLIPNHDVKG